MKQSCEPERLYRFELAFDFTPQGVGLFQGLTETGLDIDTQERLYAMFETLKAQDVETPDGSAVECWFREKGLIQFRDAINEIIYELSCNGWQVLGQEMTDDLAHALYADEYQAAFSASYLETDKRKYGEIAAISDMPPYITPMFDYIGLSEQIKAAASKASKLPKSATGREALDRD